MYSRWLLENVHHKKNKKSWNYWQARISIEETKCNNKGWKFLDDHNEYKQWKDETHVGHKLQKTELQLKCKHDNLDGIHGRQNNATTPMVTSVNI
jgi:hypothetical protein